MIYVICIVSYIVLMIVVAFINMSLFKPIMTMGSKEAIAKHFEKCQEQYRVSEILRVYLSCIAISTIITCIYSYHKDYSILNQLMYIAEFVVIFEAIRWNNKNDYGAWNKAPIAIIASMTLMIISTIFIQSLGMAGLSPVFLTCFWITWLLTTPF